MCRRMTFQNTIPTSCVWGVSISMHAGNPTFLGTRIREHKPLKAHEGHAEQFGLVSTASEALYITANKHVTSAQVQI